jgi:hypothetical protein
MSIPTELDDVGEGASLSELAPVVAKVLRETSHPIQVRAERIADCADRLWHTYSPLPLDLRKQMIEEGRDLWRSGDEDVRQYVLSAAAMLRLSELIPEIEDALCGAKISSQLRVDLESVLKLLREDPDPYSDLRKLQKAKVYESKE